MTDRLEPGDPLFDAAEMLRQPRQVAEGFPERLGRRRRRIRTQRWALGTAAACALVAVTLLVPRHSPEEIASAGLADDSIPRPVTLDVAVDPRLPDSLVKHTFEVSAPTSQSVALVGDFTDWQPDSILLRQVAAGRWEVTLQLPPGRYRYSYLVDRRVWRADDDASAVDDDFGRPTSVISLPYNP